MVGDIMKIYDGMDIPTDCIVLNSSELTADESAMTGETDPVKKANMVECQRSVHDLSGQNFNNHDIPQPILFSGTRVFIPLKRKEKRLGNDRFGMGSSSGGWGVFNRRANFQIA